MQDQDYAIEFGIPPGCMKEDCAYYVAMGPNAEDSDFLDVYLRGTAEGWVAVGFSHDQRMVCEYMHVWCMLPIGNNVYGSLYIFFVKY